MQARSRPRSHRRGLLAWLETRRGGWEVSASVAENRLYTLSLDEFLLAIKALGYAVKLDTNGTHPAHLDRLLRGGLVDYVAMDLKAPLDSRYDDVAGLVVDRSAIRRSMDLLRRWGGAYEYRTTVLPFLTKATLADIGAALNASEIWYLQRYVPVAGSGLAPSVAAIPDEQALQALAQELCRVAAGVRVRGAD